jgi:hypothetical protein
MRLESGFDSNYNIYIHDEIIELFDKHSNYKIYFEKKFINPVLWEEVENESIGHLYYLLKYGFLIDSFKELFSAFHDTFWYKKSVYRDLLKVGIRIPPCLQTHSINKREYDFDPGRTLMREAKFIGFDTIPMFIQVQKDDNIEYDGKINTIEDLKEILYKEVKLDSEIILKEDDRFPVAYDGTNLNKFSIHEAGNKKSGASGHGTYMADVNNIEYRLGFYKILTNSFPLNVYISANTKMEYDSCVKRIKKHYYFSEDKNIKLLKTKWDYDKVFYPYDRYNINIDEIKLNFVWLENDIKIYNIPKLNNYRGYSVYTKSNILWNKNILGLLYYGHTEEALAKKDDSVILFNCENSIWKYNTNPLEEHIGLLPEHYYSVD